jgi:predicted DNA-binding transcriptional regulator AlpA
MRKVKNNLPVGHRDGGRNARKLVESASDSLIGKSQEMSSVLGNQKPRGWQFTLYSPKQVAKMLCISVNTLANWRSAKIGPKWVKLNNYAVRYPREEVEKYLESIGFGV